MDKIYVTKNYEKFNLMESNRKIVPAQIKKLKESIGQI